MAEWPTHRKKKNLRNSFSRYLKKKAAQEAKRHKKITSRNKTGCRCCKTSSPHHKEKNEHHSFNHR